MKVEETGAERIKKYLPEVIKFVAKREIIDQLGGCGEIVMIYHKGKLQYANLEKITDKQLD